MTGSAPALHLADVERGVPVHRQLDTPVLCSKSLEANPLE